MRIRHVKGAEEVVDADDLVIQEPEKFKGIWCREIYKRDAPIFLEIGMGMGQFLRTMSFLYPRINFLGVEINVTVLYKAIKRYRQKLIDTSYPLTGNLRFIRCDASFLGDYFSSGEIQKIYLNFPDPWPKSRHENRRLVSPRFFKIYQEILDESGSLELKTDNEELFLYALSCLDECGWKLVAESRDLSHDLDLNKGNVVTEYETRFLAKGNAVFQLITVPAGQK